MKTDFSKLPREEVEARITTMLLGEMPADEAAELMEFVSRDSELLKLHDELKQTISLVTEASANEQPMKLSEGRREQLLESFKMVKPPELAEKTHGKIEWRNWAAMAAMVGLLLGGAAFVFNGGARYETAHTTAYLFDEEGRSVIPLSRSGRNRGENNAAMLPSNHLWRRDEDDNDSVRRAPQKPPVNAPSQGPREVRLMADAALEKSKSELTASMNQKVEEFLNSPAPTKIELPVAQTDSPVQAKNESFEFQVGQARGFGGYAGGGALRGDLVDRGLAYTDAEGKVQATTLPAEAPPNVNSINAVGYVDTSIVPGFNLQSKPLATGEVVGKDATLAYSDHFGVPAAQSTAIQPPVQSINGAWNAPAPASDGFFDRSGAGADAKTKQGEAIDAITGLPTLASATSGTIQPMTGLPADAGAAQPKFVEQDEKDPGGQQMGGGMGGRANMSMMYYMSNPELMKRYFPQMYSMMQKGREAGAAPGGRVESSAGIPGMPGLAGPTALADGDQNSFGRKAEDKPAMQPPVAMTMPRFQGGMDRYRMQATPGPYDPTRSLRAPVAKKPEAKPQPAQPEQQVALGTELKLLKEESEAPQRSKEIASKLATASGDQSGRLPADNNALVELNQGGLAVRPNDVAATEAVRRSVNNVQERREQLAAGRRLNEFEEVGKEAAPTQTENTTRDLENLRNLRASIDQRIAQEKADATNPVRAGVEIIDEAVAEDKGKRPVLGDVPILGRMFRGKEERVARLDVQKDGADITPLMPTQHAANYDPYFVQSEAEKIKSQKVLGDVVDQLKLDQKWSEEQGRRLNRTEAVEVLKRSVSVETKGNGLLEIHARGEKGAEAAQIANKVAEAYQKMRVEQRGRSSQAGVESLNKQLAEVDRQIAKKESEASQARELRLKLDGGDAAPKRPPTTAPTPQPEISTTENAFSTFSLNVSDVSFKLAAASLEKGSMPDVATVRSEEFINAFDYHDPEPKGAPIGFVWERARYPFAQGRDLLRFSVKTAASGRQAGRPLNIVLLLDNSGSMERADRVRILQECLKTLAAQLRPEDKVSVVAFARTARLYVDGLPGSQANELAQRVGNLNPAGGTNLEEAMKVAYETARKHFNAGGVNRVVLLTDGAANLGDVEPKSLKREVETERKKGIALDCFGIGWEGLNDELLETLSRNGDGRYGFVNTPEAAASEFAGQLAGALQVAASDVKVQVEWNPKRVTAYRQIGYAKHQLTKEQFRDNTVDAAEIGAAEAGNALYTVQVNAAGEGPLGTVRVRFKVPGTNDYREHAWPLDYDGAPKPLENSSYTLRLAGTASAFSEWLVSSPYATEVTTDRLLTILSGVPEHFAPDPRPKKLEWMIRQAKSLAGK